MSTKRIILANNSRLVREILRRVLEKAENLEVAHEIQSDVELSPAIKRFDPQWVVLSVPAEHNAHSWMDACVTAYPSVRFIFLAPDSSSIKMKWQFSYEEDLTNLSVPDFINILEKDIQPT